MPNSCTFSKECVKSVAHVILGYKHLPLMGDLVGYFLFLCHSAGPFLAPCGHSRPFSKAHPEFHLFMKPSVVIFTCTDDDDVVKLPMLSRIIIIFRCLKSSHYKLICTSRDG